MFGPFALTGSSLVFPYITAVQDLLLKAYLYNVYMYFVHILCKSDKNLKPVIGEIHCPAIFLYISYRLEQAPL